MSFVQKVLTQQKKSTMKWVSAGFAIFGLAYLGKAIYKKLIVKNKQNIYVQTPKLTKTSYENKSNLLFNSKISQYSEYYFDKDQQLQLIQTSLSQKPTVQQLYLNSPLIARDQFIKYTRQIRKRRRLIRKTNQDQYINLVLTYESEIKQLLFRSRLELIEFLNIQPEVFQRMEQDYQALEDLRVLGRKSEQILRSKLKTQTKYKKMSNQKLTQIVKQQLCFMRNKMYDRLKSKLKTQSIADEHQTLLVVETLLEDIIYQKFGYQVEDIKIKMEEVGYNIKQINDGRANMEKDIGGLKFDSIQSEQDEQINIKNVKDTSKTLYHSGQEQKDK